MHLALRIRCEFDELTEMMATVLNPNLPHSFTTHLDVIVPPGSIRTEVTLSLHSGDDVSGWLKLGTACLDYAASRGMECTLASIEGPPAPTTSPAATGHPVPTINPTLYAQPLAALGFERVAISYLSRAGIHTVAELVGRSVEELLDLPGLGEIRLWRLLNTLETHGLQLKQAPQPQLINREPDASSAPRLVADEVTPEEFDRQRVASTTLPRSLKRWAELYGVRTLGQFRRLPVEWFNKLPGIDPEAIMPLIKLLQEYDYKLPACWEDVRPWPVSELTGVTVADWASLPLEALELREESCMVFRLSGIYTIAGLLATDRHAIVELFDQYNLSLTGLTEKLEEYGLSLAPDPVVKTTASEDSAPS